MLKNYKTKDIEDIEMERSETHESSDLYFFPEYQITITATSLEEAEEKLKRLLESKKQEES